MEFDLLPELDERPIAVGGIPNVEFVFFCLTIRYGGMDIDVGVEKIPISQGEGKRYRCRRARLPPTTFGWLAEASKVTYEMLLVYLGTRCRARGTIVAMPKDALCSKGMPQALLFDLSEENMRLRLIDAPPDQPIPEDWECLVCIEELP